MLHQIKAPPFYTDLGLQKTVESSCKGKIQGHFKAFECFSSTFQGKFLFLGNVQVLFKPVQTLASGEPQTSNLSLKLYHSAT